MSHSGFYQSDYAVDSSIGTAPSMGYASTPYGVPPGGMSSSMPPPNYSTSTFDEEPPLLEELGINLDHIFMKAKLVLNPLSKFEKSFADEADMSGPVLFCLLLGLFLLLGGKVQFGQIYGQASIGCLSIYAVFNLMSKDRIDLYRSTSILGYSLLPMIIMAALRVFIPHHGFQALVLALSIIAIVWCTSTATKIFVAVQSLTDQVWLVAYPLCLLYTSFALITIF